MPRVVGLTAPVYNGLGEIVSSKADLAKEITLLRAAIADAWQLIDNDLAGVWATRHAHVVATCIRESL